MMKSIPVSLSDLLIGEWNSASNDSLKPSIHQLLRTLDDSSKIDEAVDMSLIIMYSETGLQSQMLLLFLYLKALML